MSVDPRYKELYIREARRRLANAESALDVSNIESSFRAFHTLKGMSAAMCYDGITQLSHALEEVCLAVREGLTPLDTEAETALRGGLVQLGLMIEEIAAGGDPPAEAALPDALRGSLMRALGRHPSGAPEQGGPAPQSVAADAPGGCEVAPGALDRKGTP